MATKIFINLPVINPGRSRVFFTDLGFTIISKFTDEKATCIGISDNIYAMLLTNGYFKTFTNKEICNTETESEVLIALDATSKEEVQQIIEKARALGGQIHTEPQDHGWMYQHGFADLDGHQWEFMYIDENQLPNQD
jgi:predicted lactoylglutathione lyase